MEIGTDTTARIAADILSAALESKAIYTSGRDHTTKAQAEQISEAFTIIQGRRVKTVRRTVSPIVPCRYWYGTA